MTSDISSFTASNGEPKFEPNWQCIQEKQMNVITPESHHQQLSPYMVAQLVNTFFLFKHC